METLSLIRISTNSDTVEGRGSPIVHGYTRDFDVGRQIIRDPRFRRNYTMGIMTESEQKYMLNGALIKIFDDVEDFFGNTKDQIKQRALNKLTPEEREALGV